MERFISSLPHSILRDHISRLPHDILRDHILPYTYRPQDGELLGDIVSFHSTWTMIERNYKEAFQALGLQGSPATVTRDAVYPTMMHNMKRYCQQEELDEPFWTGTSCWCNKWCRTVWCRWAPYRRQYFVAEKVPVLQYICSRAETMDADQRANFAYSASTLLEG